MIRVESTKILHLTAGISKKLVTIFALHLDSFIMTPDLSSVYQFCKAGIAKIAPWCLASRDKLLAKVLGTLRSAQGWPAGLRHQRFLLIPATVSCKL
jgi:hypothetical protein